MPIEQKVCVVCDQEKEKKMSFRRSQVVCKECEEKGTVYDKKCSRCGEIKKSDTFRKNRLYCLDCERDHGRNYRKNTTKAKEWVEANTERMAELQNNHYQVNKKKIRARERERYSEDDLFKKVKLYRSGLQTFIRGYTKTNKHIGAPRERYMKWLEFSKHEGVSLEKREEWHIDHVIPFNMLRTYFADQEDAYIFIFAWYNTVPVLAKTNLKKNKYLDANTLFEHQKTLNNYFNKNRNILGMVKMSKKPSDKQYFKYRQILQNLIDSKIAVF